MKEVCLKFLTVAVFCCSCVNLQESPNVFPICSRKVADLGQCIKDALNKLRPNLASGRLSPDFIIQPLDPYVLQYYEVPIGRYFKLKFTDTEMKGATSFRLVDIKAYFEGDFLKFMPHIEIDRIDVKTKYFLDGPFTYPQTGEFSLSLTDLKVHGNGRVRIYKKNGKEYFNIEQAKLMFDSIKLGNIRYSFIVGGVRDPKLLNMILQFVGDPIMKAVYKMMEKQIDDLHLQVANELIKDVPVSYFFSE